MLPNGTDVIVNGPLTLHIGVAETIGSLSGAGSVAFFQGTGNHLRVGQNDSSTVFSGVIEDHTPTSGNGALTKLGTGTLTLTGSNTYSEGTNLIGGNLPDARNVTSAKYRGCALRRTITDVR